MRTAKRYKPPDAMHILLIHAYFLPDGAAGSVRWNETVRYWAEAGHRVTVLTGSIDYLTGNSYGAGSEISIRGVEVIRVGMSNTYPRGYWGRLWAYWTFFWNSLWVVLLQVSVDVDIILATSPPLTVGLTGWFASVLRHKPFVMEVRDLWPDAPRQMGYLNNRLAAKLALSLEQFLYRRAAHLVTLTAAFERVLVEQKGVPPGRCTTISNGADLALTQSALVFFDRVVFRRQHDLQGRFWIIYAGAHGPANGLMAVIEAAETLHNKPVGFLLLGDGPEKGALQTEANRRGLTNVRFLPAMPKPDVIRWIAAADAGLVRMQPLPVFQTMLSAKLFDYLACGKPIFAAIDGLTTQLVDDYKLGLTLAPREPLSWCESIRLYLEQPRLATEHGCNGQAYVREHADRVILAHRYLSTLSHVH